MVSPNENKLTTKEAVRLGERIAVLVSSNQQEEAYSLLAPILAARTPFRILGRIGEPVGAGPLDTANAFLQRIAMEKTEGGWVIIGVALGAQLDRDISGAFERCRAFTIDGDVWYATDILGPNQRTLCFLGKNLLERTFFGSCLSGLGERVPGPSLVANFHPTMELLSIWQEDTNRWVRRSIGVATHFWAKRSRGNPELRSRVSELLSFLEPMFTEWEMDAVKGVGWGLKTLGRHYPDVVAKWLTRQVDRRHRAIMLRKAITYLPEELRSRLHPTN